MEELEITPRRRAVEVHLPCLANCIAVVQKGNKKEDRMLSLLEEARLEVVRGMLSCFQGTLPDPLFNTGDSPQEQADEVKKPRLTEAGFCRASTAILQAASDLLPRDPSWPVELRYLVPSMEYSENS